MLSHGKSFPRGKDGGVLGKSVFGVEAERALTQARIEAIGLGHGQVGSEHLFLGILSVRHTKASLVLNRFGWTAEAVRGLLPRGTPNLPLPQGLSENARQILLRAAQIADELKSALITAEHLLMAILRTQTSAAVRLLWENGTDPDCMFTDLYLIMQDVAEPAAERRTVMRLLEQFCDDMVEQASAMDPVVGRQREIETVIAILSRKNKNNPALVGEPGVGKTAVAEGLAQCMAAGRVPEQLQGKRLLRLNMASVLAGTKYRGEFEERIRDILAEIRRCGNVILFIDEMHTLVGAGSAEGAIDAANLLKPALGRGEIQVLGATTLEEYRRHIEKDAALERRFRPVEVKEPSKEETMAMLEGLRPGLEKHHRIRISEEAMTAAIELSCRYLCDHFLPDKAVDILDEAAAVAAGRRRGDGYAEEARRKLHGELTLAVKEDRFEQAAALRDRLQQITRQQRTLFGKTVLDREDVALVIARRTGVPVGKVTSSDKERLLQLKQSLQQRVIGQPGAVEAVAAAVCRGRLGLADEARPVASMLFLGPTGVGKTALCKALAECVFGSCEAMVRLDMSEFMEQHAVSRLIGAPPGYVGHGEGGELTEKVRRRPYCVVLFDEVEKAHRDVLGLLLQVMEDGLLTDSMGRHVNFKNTIIVMTSNLGSGSHVMEQVGFLGNGQTAGAKKALKEFFTPEFLGRLDCTVEFSPLNTDTLRAIAERELQRTVSRAQQAGVRLQTDRETAAYLAETCLQGEGGAREVRRLIRSTIETAVAEKLLCARGELKLHTRVKEGVLSVQEN